MQNLWQGELFNHKMDVDLFQQLITNWLIRLPRRSKKSKHTFKDFKRNKSLFISGSWLLLLCCIKKLIIFMTGCLKR